MSDKTETKATDLDKVLSLISSIKENQLTRKDIEDVATELVERKLVEAGERGIHFTDDKETTLPTNKGFTPKTSFTPEEQKELDKVFLYKTILGSDAAKVSPWVQKTLATVHGIDFEIKAQDPTSLSGLIPTGLSPQLELEIQLRLLVAPQFPEIRMPTNPFLLPVQTSRTTAYKVSQGQTAPTASSAGISQVTLNLEKLAVLTEFTYEVEADSLVPVLDMLRNDIINTLARQIDDNIINGKTTNATGQTAVYNTWQGLKWLANDYGSVASAAQVSVFSTTDVLNMRGDMGIRGVRTDDLVLFVGVNGYNDLLADTNVKTVDKFGPGATILRGQVADVFGVPIVLSEFVNTTSGNMGNTSGLAANKDMVLASRSGFIVGRPGGPGAGPGLNPGTLVEQDKNITTQVVSLVASTRIDFQPMQPVAITSNPPVSHRFHKV